MVSPLRVRLIGPFEVDGLTPHAVGSRKARTLLKLLTLGRGNAVDEQALVEALESGRIAGAFLDVFEQEPLPPDSPLWDAPNLEFLPHASAISREYLDLWLEELAGLFSGARS